MSLTQKLGKRGRFAKVSPYLHEISVHIKKGRVNLTLPLLFLLTGRSTICAEICPETPVTPLRANPLASRGNYEAAATAATAAAAFGAWYSGINR